MVLGVAFLLWLVLLAPKLLVPELSDASLSDVADPVKRHELQDARLKLQNDVRATLLQGLGGIALLAGAFFASRQLRVTRDQLQHNIRATHEEQELHRQSQITERFSRAIDQIGTAKLDIQLGGIYALERIANDSPPDRNTIAEVLSAYIRTHSPWPPSQPGQPDAHEPIDDVPSLRTRAPDVQAAITVLSRRSLAPDRSQPLDLRRVDLRRIPFEGLQLVRVDFGNAHLERAHLPNADLKAAHFGAAHLQEANLANAHLEGARFIETNLEGANLYGTHLEEAWFTNANLKKADLIGAILERVKGLESAHLEGAISSTHMKWPNGFNWKAAGVVED
jgi:pentapeptide repeat protein